MEYEAVIGLEVHAQILTESKMFCGCSADYANAAPNTHTCPVCLGLPGALPVLNQRAVELMAMTGRALNCRINHDTYFDRKNYFYVDLPSSYQRSQYQHPLCVAGWVEIETAQGARRIGITRAHMEEDTGKLTHVDGASLVDYNRSGVPLLEIVSEPDLRTPEEARLYCAKMRQLLVWIGVNSGNLEEGAMRFDVNVSVRPKGSSKLGAKVEIKNLNSLRSVERALQYEIKRQIEVLSAGGTIVQETRGWDEDRGVTLSQRSKEYAHDYRYFPDPDLPPLALSDAWIAERDAALPELPDARRRRFEQQYGLPAQDAALLTSERVVADYFEAAVAAAAQHAPKQVANWIIGELFRLLNDSGEALSAVATRLRPEYIRELLDLLREGAITGTTAKQVFEESFRSGQSPAAIVDARGLRQISDSDAVRALAQQAVEANPKVVNDYRSGKSAALKFLVGQVMRLSKGQANPQLAEQALRDILDR
ncbi:Asp-tRNA(Asn)/Glu-tRNA(Gln) amidotransferase subunit GatB [Kallotenue papyrolyticum]|uniref:Asp-tRNA(Asn)/Glu-tRNA(Gln) amidotransferase subunit GatB n=1 Tax=Kallotenue papyrolyticum TaxID=1325125 RepID=UPI0004786017|nr:Asp-tRNA(Asn)/Glu-tRNA(Gln) amidotransferase subunit GatB [Kallotenue papyrolyticum]